MKKWLWLLPLAGILLFLWSPWNQPAPAVLAEEELLAAADGLDEIRIDCVFLPDSRSMRVTQEMTLTSRYPQTLDELVLRTMPNAYQSAQSSPLATVEDYEAFYPDGFSAGALVMESARIGDQPVRHRYTDEEKTVLSLPVEEGWQPGQTLLVTLKYTLIVPNAASRYGAYEGVYSFGNAFALPAVWEEGSWRTDAFVPVGDPFYSDSFNFRVTVSAPDSFQCAASALPSEKQKKDGSILWQFDAPARRDFALCFSEDYRLSSVTRGGLTVQTFTRSKAAGREAMRYALHALEIYGRLYGPYPYGSFTIAEISFPYAGMEYPGMILLSQDTLAARGDTLEHAVAHETAHQWWYALVGSDPVNHPWQDEALCEFSRFSYWKLRYGQSAAERILRQEFLPSLQITMPSTAGAPLDYFSGMGEYSILVYNRGAAALCALDDMMNGDLNGFLKFYRERFTFRIASREDFFAALRDYSGQDYEPLLTDYLDTKISP